MNQFRNDVKPNWCPGCGDFAVQAAIQKTASNLGLNPHDLAVISGIGCSGRISGYVNSYSFHSIHGRALPVAQGVKLANNNLKVIASGGDGDGFAIGMAHTVHAMRRNIDLTYIVMDNQIYGLTKGQTSPRSAEGSKTKSSPDGSLERSISVLELAIASGATFVAQAFSGDIKQLTELIQKGMEHEGFSLINVFSPCVTYNKTNTYEWFKERIVSLPEDYDRTNRALAMQTVIESNGLATGLIYQQEIPSYVHKLNQETAMVDLPLKVDEALFNELMEEFA